MGTWFVVDDHRKKTVTLAAAESNKEPTLYVWGGSRPSQEASKATLEGYDLLKNYNVTHIAFGPDSMLAFVASGKVYVVHPSSPSHAQELPFFGKKISNGPVSYLWHLGGKKVSAQYVAWTKTAMYVVAKDNSVWKSGGSQDEAKEVDRTMWNQKDPLVFERLEVQMATRAGGNTGGKGPSGISKIVGGDSHILVLTDTGEVYTSGNNDNGQCGVGQSTKLLRKDQWVYSEDAKDLKTIARKTLLGAEPVVTDNGLEEESESSTSAGDYPEIVPGLLRIDQRHFSGVKVVDIAAGGQHSVFVTEGGGVFSCGLNSSFQLGQKELLPTSSYMLSNRYSVQFDPSIPFRVVPTRVTLPDFKGKPLLGLRVAAGDKHTALIGEIAENKSVVCTWGEGISGQLGNANLLHMSFPKVLNTLQFSIEYISTPEGDLKVPVFPVSVAAGSNHTAVLLSNGTLYCFGNNKSSQCGVHTKKKLVNTPAMLKKLAYNVTITDLFAGEASTAACGVPKQTPMQQRPSGLA